MRFKVCGMSTNGITVRQSSFGHAPTNSFLGRGILVLCTNALIACWKSYVVQNAIRAYIQIYSDLGLQFVVWVKNGIIPRWWPFCRIPTSTGCLWVWVKYDLRLSCMLSCDLRPSCMLSCDFFPHTPWCFLCYHYPLSSVFRTVVEWTPRNQNMQNTKSAKF